MDLRDNFPANIDKTAEIFSALVANDRNTGALESALNDLQEFMHSWYSTPSLYDQTDEQLDRTLSFFSYLVRFTGETDASIKNRMAALFIRNHDTAWGSRYNIKRIFQQYFPSGTIYVVENSYPYEDSLIQDGDFTSLDMGGWSRHGVEIAERARFSRSNGAVLIGPESELSQSVDIDNHKDSAFFLHFFCKGCCSVEILDNNGNYWNHEAKLWQSAPSAREFDNEEWDNCCLWFTNFTEGMTRTVNEGISSVTVKFKGGSGNECFIDYVRLFEKFPYPSFTVIAHFSKSNSFGALGLFPGDSDSAGESPTYRHADYYDQVYMSGVAAGFAQDLYQDLLDNVRTVGVKANIEIVTRDGEKTELS